jgi:hypothetical protein
VLEFQVRERRLFLLRRRENEHRDFALDVIRKGFEVTWTIGP